MANNLENILGAFEALRVNRFRTFLTLLGIVIGVAAVIMVGAAVQSGKTIIFDELQTFGLKSLWVFRSFTDDQPGKTVVSGSGIDTDDISAIMKSARQVRRLAPVCDQWNLWAKYANNYIKIQFIASGPDYKPINNDTITRGRFLIPEDLEYRRDVCVIGTKVVNKLFGSEDPLGKEIKAGESSYRVIGILKEKNRDFLASIGSGGGQDANNRVIVPITLYQRRTNTREIEYLQAEALDVSMAKTAAEEIKNILHVRHRGQYAYESQTMQQYIETAERIVQGVSWIGAIAAIVSLVVGGIGIMNIMTVSVVERIREIGLRKALGAKRSDILVQFLSEAIAISLLGGVVGTLMGIGLIWIIQILSNKPRLLAPEYIVAALAVSILTGILSGLYPAHRAASLDPVEALRHE
ncbi:MAG: ABC transporter permease [bacterium]